MTKREKEIIQGVVNALREVLAPERIFLFGSRAKGDNDPRADFDFAVDCPEMGVSVLRAVRERIDGIRGLYKVDIVHLDSVDEAFRRIIEKTGTVIYER
jgi:predicted nucleotidyltransferase